MKDLSLVWFLKSPIDTEHKHYILLDFLKSVNEEIRKNRIYSPVKKIFSLIREMKYFVQTGSLSEEGMREISEEDKILLKEISLVPLTDQEKVEIRNIIDSSLSALYKYADLGINLWKGAEDKIKIYNLENPRALEKSGVSIFRNMSTNEIFPYWWRKAEIKIDGEVKTGIILKKIPLLNNYYSMSYEFVLHETLVSMGIKNGTEFPCTIIEISEDFNQDSEIFKIAKDKFFETLN